MLKRSDGPVGNKRSAWHAVSIACKRNRCAASLKLAGARFLSKDAPKLPLADCSRVADCKCLYQHYDDRRGDPRRAAEAHGLLRGSYAGQERRRQGGRRESDLRAFVDWKG
jgi:hypothetical protein